MAFQTAHAIDFDVTAMLKTDQIVEVEPDQNAKVEFAPFAWVLQVPK